MQKATIALKEFRSFAPRAQETLIRVCEETGHTPQYVKSFLTKGATVEEIEMMAETKITRRGASFEKMFSLSRSYKVNMFEVDCLYALRNDTGMTLNTLAYFYEAVKRPSCSDSLAVEELENLCAAMLEAESNTGQNWWKIQRRVKNAIEENGGQISALEVARELEYDESLYELETGDEWIEAMYDGDYII